MPTRLLLSDRLGETLRGKCAAALLDAHRWDVPSHLAPALRLEREGEFFDDQSATSRSVALDGREARLADEPAHCSASASLTNTMSSSVPNRDAVPGSA